MGKSRRLHRNAIVLHCYTDGGCVPNPGTGAFSYVVVEDDKIVHQYAELVEDTTNNRMELAGVIHCLHYLKNAEAVIYMDSKYVFLGITEWRKKWIRNKWAGVKNPDLWQQLSFMVDKMPNVSFKWVKGHAESKWNNHVDKLCTAELNKRKKQG